MRWAAITLGTEECVVVGLLHEQLQTCMLRDSVRSAEPHGIDYRATSTIH
jgi:hypothetical protein